MRLFRWLKRCLRCRCRRWERYERNIAYLTEVLEQGYQREMKTLYEVERQTRRLRDSTKALADAVAAQSHKPNTAGDSQ